MFLQNVHEDMPCESCKFGAIIFICSRSTTKQVFVPFLVLKQLKSYTGISLLMSKNNFDWLKTCNTHLLLLNKSEIIFIVIPSTKSRKLQGMKV